MTRKRHLEFHIQSYYSLHLDIEYNDRCHGTVMRLPDEVEGYFNDIAGLLALLEAMGGSTWWGSNRERLEQQFAADREDTADTS